MFEDTKQAVQAEPKLAGCIIIAVGKLAGRTKGRVQ